MFKNLYKFQKFSDSVVIVFATSYINPISYLPIIEKELNNINFDGKVVFDLLLTNGFSSNRFVESHVNNAKINRKSMQIIEGVDETLIKICHDFYKCHPELLENSVLLDEERYQLIHS